MLPDGPEGFEALLDPVCVQDRPEELVAELRSLIRHEVTGASLYPDGGFQDRHGLLRGGILVEDLDCEREAGEDVQYHGDAELPQAEQRPDRSEVHDPHVVDVLGLEHPGAWPVPAGAEGCRGAA